MLFVQTTFLVALSTYSVRQQSHSESSRGGGGIGQVTYKGAYATLVIIVDRRLIGYVIDSPSLISDREAPGAIHVRSLGVYAYPMSFQKNIKL